jgi:hypothetical protein
MSAQEGKKSQKHAIDNDPDAGEEKDPGEEQEAMTEPEPDPGPKSKSKAEPPAKAHAAGESKRAEGTQPKSKEEKGKSMAQIMRFDRRGGKRR